MVCKPFPLKGSRTKKNQKDNVEKGGDLQEKQEGGMAVKGEGNAKDND